MAKLILHQVSIGTLQNINLEVAPEEIVCLSGPSGAGKSRLLRAVADLEPHGGTVKLGNLAQGLVPGHRWRRSVMMVPAESAWWFDTVGEHLYKPMPKALHALGFDEDVSEWSVSRLSSGEKQRLALIRALSREPDVLLLDEPTANLDEKTTRQVEDWLISVIHARNRPVLWVAHSREQIRRVAKRHFCIEGSKLLELQE
ncbi:ATP-binding cassette domain-containing protein [Microbulbifer thermotolerans]|uniref:ATP-binding cassette domain-containing protein n=1 Tax=Microbulbifer thermotolerans TaxID=252514 RepID=A0AB35HV73_MICTH|nr:ATP-binding cassette domain-containing protein [Microbulbifer thermotolerans]MCX2801100.1 ATP-binding cassette domain-containing protein [Microbulbifer thermotolerans]